MLHLRVYDVNGIALHQRKAVSSAPKVMVVGGRAGVSGRGHGRARVGGGEGRARHAIRIPIGGEVSERFFEICEQKKENPKFIQGQTQTKLNTRTTAIYKI